jgi:hypothetical protein
MVLSTRCDMDLSIRRTQGRVLWIATVGLSIGCGNLCAQQPSNKQLSPQQITKLLQHPGGLRAAANAVGAFVLDSDWRSWGDPDLQALVADSSLIFTGKVIGFTSRLSDNENNLVTDFTMHADEVLKGTIPHAVSFSARGGKVVFPNGTSAEVRTVVWDRLKPGGVYLVFLEKDYPEYKKYVPTGNAVGLFDISATDGSFDWFASHEPATHAITQEVSSFSRQDLFRQIRAFVSGESAVK